MAAEQTETEEYWLARNMRDALKLPEEAIEWLLALWDTIQIFDDLVDFGNAPRDDINRGIWQSLIGLPDNPFYRRHSQMLMPVMANAIFKWHAANTVEDAKQPSAMSYAWRAGYYDVILAAVACHHGPNVAQEYGHLVMAMYGEDFGEYMKEFSDA